MQCSSVDEVLFPRPHEGGGDVRRELMDLRTMIDSQSCGHCSHRFGRKKIMMLNRTFTSVSDVVEAAVSNIAKQAVPLHIVLLRLDARELRQVLWRHLFPPLRCPVCLG
ncbi:hypothetical protein PHYPSEUDO_000168 [Phytophthora pseudosyringae]|uniref:Uncharacterized protein n=1 Tax=Phytophthora pseudosyringae TaxID=221518 RepID=A0A8T1WKC9_9STRA|nr:hypothetical protein PHYPSEUDO_000168 [Phytophthora pseudosyringae]